MELAWDPQPEPAELKCTKGTSTQALPLKRVVGAAFSTLISFWRRQEKTLKLTALLPAVETAVQNVALSPRGVLPFCENGPL